MSAKFVRRKSKGWSAQAVPHWNLSADESLESAVLRDFSLLASRYGSFPSIERYRSHIDPINDAAAAEAFLFAAFFSAGVHAPQVAGAWRERWPAWQQPIERCLGAAMIARDMEAESTPLIGLRIGARLEDGDGRYEITRELGGGAFGRVFEALDRTLSRCGAPACVALKVVRSKRSDTRDAISRLLREAGAARAIAHGGVARVLDAGEIDEAALKCFDEHFEEPLDEPFDEPFDSQPDERSDGPADSQPFGGDVAAASDRSRKRMRAASEVDRSDSQRSPAVFIVTEFVEGLPLYLWIACGQRTWQECTTILDSLEAAVRACHAKSIEHGDISPANLMIDAEGSPRLIDFGLSAWNNPSPQEGEAVQPREASSEIQRVASTLSIGERDRVRLTELKEWLQRECVAIAPLERGNIELSRSQLVSRAARQTPRRQFRRFALAALPVLAFSLGWMALRSEPLAVRTAAQRLFDIDRLEGGPDATLEHQIARRILETGDLSTNSVSQGSEGAPSTNAEIAAGPTNEVLLKWIQDTRIELARARREGSPNHARELLLASALAAHGDYVWPKMYAFGALQNVALEANDPECANDRRALAESVLKLNQDIRFATNDDRLAEADRLAAQLHAPGLSVLARRALTARVPSKVSEVEVLPRVVRPVP
jgi:serine/threonine protein kinase